MEIKVLIFDLDGVLVNTSFVHFNALNKALNCIDPSYQISEEEDTKYFGTVTTKEKLNILTKIKGFPLNKHNEVINLKKYFTLEILSNLNAQDYSAIELKTTLEKLSKTYSLYICSNTNYQFIYESIKKLDILQYFSKIFSNLDVSNNKPNPEIYLKTFIDAGVSPQECLIFEDSITGQEAAIKSGAYVCGIETPFDLTYDNICNKINLIKPKSIKWNSEKINVLIPMAGEGTRFKEAGFITPKPLIDVNGLPMVGLVAEKLNIDAHFIFVVKGEHCEQYNLETLLNLISPGCTIIKTWGKQGGAACSILEAENVINNEEHLLIVNSDQIWDWNSRLFYHQMIKENLDGGIVTFEDPNRNPKWSFARVDEFGYVTEVAEKNPISDLATAGIYYFKHGSDFVKFAKQMISKNIKVNNEFYVCPVYNEAVLDGQKIKTFNVEKMWGLGIPEDLKYYLDNHKS